MLGTIAFDCALTAVDVELEGFISCVSSNSSRYSVCDVIKIFGIARKECGRVRFILRISAKLGSDSIRVALMLARVKLDSRNHMQGRYR